MQVIKSIDVPRSICSFETTSNLKRWFTISIRSLLVSLYNRIFFWDIFYYNHFLSISYIQIYRSRDSIKIVYFLKYIYFSFILFLSLLSIEDLKKSTWSFGRFNFFPSFLNDRLLSLWYFIFLWPQKTKRTSTWRRRTTCTCRGCRSLTRPSTRPGWRRSPRRSLSFTRSLWRAFWRRGVPEVGLARPRTLPPRRTGRWPFARSCTPPSS